MQMIRHVLNREIIQKVRARLDQSSKEAPILANSIEMESSPEAGSHVKFGSPDRTLQMQYFLQELAKRHSLEMKYLTEKLQRYLYYRVPSLQQDDILRPREHHLPDISGFSVRLLIPSSIQSLICLMCTGCELQKSSDRLYIIGEFE